MWRGIAGIDGIDYIIEILIWILYAQVSTDRPEIHAVTGMS